jgi:predicted SAM-dependent methyltransferase
LNALSKKLQRVLRRILYKFAKRLYSRRTVKMMKYDLARFDIRMKRENDHGLIPAVKKLHLGCGSRLVRGWLNVDLKNSDYNLDLTSGKLPWQDNVFDVIVSEHFIEHLDLESEVLPLIRELNRVIKPEGEIWLSCPDIEKICHSYLEHEMEDLIADRKTRLPEYTLGDIPSTHMINHLFHRGIQHQNLFDLKLLTWTLEKCGFSNVARRREADLLKRFPDFPERKDDRQTLYVSAVRLPGAILTNA